MHDSSTAEFRTVDGAEYRKTFLTHMRQMIETGETSYAAIAELTGYSRPVIYRVIQQTDTVDEPTTDKLIKVLAKVYDNKVQLNLAMHRIIVETAQYRIARAALEAALREPSIIVVIGAPGFGKTFACDQFMFENPARVAFYRCLKTDSPKDMLAALWNEEARQTGIFSRSHILRQIIKRLSITKEMIVVDEGDRLDFDRLEILRDISDADMSIQKPKTSIVIFGNYDLDNTINSGDWRGETATTRSQLNRRVKRIYMKDMVPDDVINYCHTFQFPKDGLTFDQAAELVILLNTNGGFGLLEQVRRVLATNVSRGKLAEGEVDFAIILETLKQLLTPGTRRYAR